MVRDIHWEYGVVILNKNYIERPQICIINVALLTVPYKCFQCFDSKQVYQLHEDMNVWLHDDLKKFQNKRDSNRDMAEMKSSWNTNKRKIEKDRK